MDQALAHEGYHRRDEAPTATTRAFGWLLAVVFALLAALAWWKSSTRLPLWLMFSAASALLALFLPRLLEWPLRGWMALGRGLAALFNPIVLGLMFGLLFVPLALWFRLIGRDVLQRRLDPAARSYWIERAPNQELGARMKRPF